MTGIVGNQVGAAGTADNSVIINWNNNLDYFDTFMLMSTAGAMDVYGSLDGTNYSTAPIAMSDLGATTADPVIVTVAGRMYGFKGKYKALRVLQNGATNVANAILRHGTM
jgi:hypothetical protein